MCRGDLAESVARPEKTDGPAFDAWGWSEGAVLVEGRKKSQRRLEDARGRRREGWERPDLQERQIRYRWFPGGRFAELPKPMPERPSVRKIMRKNFVSGRPPLIAINKSARKIPKIGQRELRGAYVTKKRVSSESGIWVVAEFELRSFPQQ
jgi:hypothetical protein